MIEIVVKRVELGTNGRPVDGASLSYVGKASNMKELEACLKGSAEKPEAKYGFLFFERHVPVTRQYVLDLFAKS